MGRARDLQLPALKMWWKRELRMRRFPLGGHAGGFRWGFREAAKEQPLEAVPEARGCPASLRVWLLLLSWPGGGRAVHWRAERKGKGLWSQKKLARLAEPRFLHRPPTPDLLTPNRPHHTCAGPPVGGTHREEAVQSFATLSASPCPQAPGPAPLRCLVQSLASELQGRTGRGLGQMLWLAERIPPETRLGLGQAFGTLSSVTMRLLQVVLAAVFIIFQLPPGRSTLKDPVTCVVESA
ncbi:uncharacterized protein LOC113596536 isoform X2 [Acinonyx jubatus]|uniref:Uncharacterized protein LOC113596536 isoform X2 n=1 Tax=Acinonyx jubatus TaxID=32536 RepID=A0ABM3PKK6_ACIJB|nr:uncharacterized protein LOC113596536 isoform X2 [Acinonyx jubatus]